MTSHQILERSFGAVIIAKTFTIKDRIEATASVEDGCNSPSSAIHPSYLHGLSRNVNPDIPFIWSCSFPRLGVGADSRVRADRRRHYSQQCLRKSSTLTSARGS